MLPVLNIYFGLIRNMMENENDSSDEEQASLSERSYDMSEFSDGTVTDQDDPDYLPGDIMDDDSQYTEPADLRAELVYLADDIQNEDIPDEGIEYESQPLRGNVRLPAASRPSRRNVRLPAASAGNVDPKESASNVEPKVESERPALGAEKPIEASQRGADDDGQICTICFEPWTNSSDHRLVSLRCGHLFGRSCITRWLKGHNPRCPQCNARARKSEIRNIYAKAVKVLDSAERDIALRDLAREAELRKSAEMSVVHEKIKHAMATQECERLKKELMEAQKLLHEYRTGSKIVHTVQAASSSMFSLVQNIEIAKTGGCRIVDSCDLLGMILVSQSTTNNPLFPGFGFRKISTDDMKAAEFVLVHQKAIRDMAIHPNDAMVLTASMDKTLKLTNMLANSVIQTYSLPSEAWSCAWDAQNPLHFYSGLKTGEVYMYDIRVTNRYVYELPKFGNKTPVVSLQYLQQPRSASYSTGPIVGKLSDCALFQKVQTEEQFRIVPMPPLGPFTCLSTGPSGHFLVSCRPSPKQPRVTHTLCDFVTAPSGDIVCCPVKTVVAGRCQVQLTRAKLLSHPSDESSSLICAGDEDAHGSLVWDGSSGQCIGNLRTDSPVLDMNGLKMNHKSYLTALTTKSLRVYCWKDQ